MIPDVSDTAIGTSDVTADAVWPPTPIFSCDEASRAPSGYYCSVVLLASPVLPGEERGADG